MKATVAAETGVLSGSRRRGWARTPSRRFRLQRDQTRTPRETVSCSTAMPWRAPRLDLDVRCPDSLIA